MSSKNKSSNKIPVRQAFPYFTKKYALIAELILSLTLASPSFAGPISSASQKGTPSAIQTSTLSQESTGKYMLPYGIAACTESERWYVPKGSPSPVRFSKEFLALIAGKGSKIVSFSEALSVRRLAKNDAEKAYSEYWLARALFSAGMVHLAFQGFNVIVSQPVRMETIPFQLTAMDCLAVIHRRYPALELAGHLAGQLVEMNRLTEGRFQDVPSLKRGVQKTALALLMSKQYAEGNQTADARQGISLLVGKGSFEAFVLGVYHASKNAHSKAIEEFARFFSSPDFDSPIFKPYLNQARLLYGRALYSKERFKESVQQYKAINPRSNEWIHALSEMSWAYLMDEQYQDTIGTAVGLQAGIFKQTFAPEALMVMAMGLNEICRFPESMNVVRTFRNRYRDAYKWLKSQEPNPKSPTQNRDYYRMAIDFAKKTPNLPVPISVASEWIRSPIFIASQEVINLVFEEKKLAESLSIQGKKEQRDLTLGLIAQVRKLRKDFQTAKIRMKPGENVYDRLASSTKQEMEIVKNNLILLRHIKNAAPFWRKMLATYQAKVPAIQASAVNNVRQEIARLNQRMLRTLDEISENNELIEVEILNGASEDMIWQNANPELAEKVKKSKMQKMSAAEEKVWNWGKTQGGFDGGGEIWEDEAGSLSAELYDNCKNKDKYAGVQ